MVTKSRSATFTATFLLSSLKMSRASACFPFASGSFTLNAASSAKLTVPTTRAASKVQKNFFILISFLNLVLDLEPGTCGQPNRAVPSCKRQGATSVGMSQNVVAFRLSGSPQSVPTSSTKWAALYLQKRHPFAIWLKLCLGAGEFFSAG